MTTRQLLALLSAFLLLISTTSAQCLLPGTENFDSATPGTSSYGLANAGVLPAGWTQGTGPNGWKVYSASTSSSNTGPTSDHTGLGGNYLYTETSG